jgi:hypothetical protein
MSKGKTTTSTAVDPRQMAMFEDLYSKGKSIFNTPFTPFTGEGVAGFTPDQLFIQDQARGMFDESFGLDPRGKLNELASQDAPSLLSADLNAYQNPFREQVIDNTLNDLDRARQIQLQSDQDAAIGRGAFGGSRSALLEAETNRNFADRAGDAVSRLNLQGYDRATNLASQDIGREMQNRQFQSNLFGNQLADQYQNFGILSGIGNQQQMLNQAGIDFNFNEFLRQQDDPYKRLAALTGAVSGIPVNQSTTSQKKTGLGDILGAGSQLAGMYFLGQSDERLKENIKLIGTSENGHNVYTWDWNNKAKELGVNNPTIGVIAQEVKKYMPEAVIKDDNGYYMVNYGAL